MTGSAPQTWAARLRGHDYELDVYPGMSARLVLRVDGEQVHDEESPKDDRTITLDEQRRLVVRLSFLGTIKRATVHDGAADLDLQAPAGSKAARRQAWGQSHPVLFALRHVVVKGLGVLVVLLGLSAIVKAFLAPYIRAVVEWFASWMPDIRLPRIPWPDIDLPDIPWPDIPWPRIHAPDWLVAILEADEYWKPILIGLLIAAVEVRRQVRQRRLRARGVDVVEESETRADAEAGPKLSLRESFRRELAKLEAEEAQKARAKAGDKDRSGAQVTPVEAEEGQRHEDEAGGAERAEPGRVRPVREG